MLQEIKNELKSLLNAVKTLNFKESFIFLSLALITFVSMYYASPNFFRRTFDTADDKFYSTLYWFSADGILMFIVPIILIPLVLRGKLSDYGFRVGDYKFGLKSASFFIILMLPVLWIASGSESFSKAYPQGGTFVRENIEVLLYYELFVGFYMLAWEFFWRGYVLFGLKEKFGIYAIFIQMIPFFILHRGKPELETFASIFAGLVLGIQAWRANSFIYCFIVHWCVVIFIDVISVLRYKSDSYGIGPDAFLKLFYN
ncbi:MAG: CPBP family intramembrane metalloprotease [Chlorobi bacterium]|nr:CPBP family intramembrane metalloprotease [Chlorobiota bacterium]MCI0715003.1 CPBP family intramembrane metalloprotease [Chlorobiota bacterium]